MSGGRVDLIIKLPPPSTTFMTALSGSDLAQRNFSCIFCQKRIPMFVVAFLKLGGKVFKKSISSPGNKQTKKTRNKLFTFYPLFTLHMKVGIANWMTKWGCPNLSVSLTTVQISLSLSLVQVTLICLTKAKHSKWLNTVFQSQICVTRSV